MQKFSQKNVAQPLPSQRSASARSKGLFFAGFCLIANGAYIAGGAFDRIGDAGEMLRHGSPLWCLLAFGAVTVPAGLWLWHRQGPYFGLGPARGKVNPIAAYSCFAVLFALIALGLIVDGE